MSKIIQPLGQRQGTTSLMPHEVTWTLCLHHFLLTSQVPGWQACPKLMLFKQWICITNEKSWASETPNLTMTPISILLTFAPVGDIIVFLWCNNILYNYNLFFAVEGDTISISHDETVLWKEPTVFKGFHGPCVYILGDIFLNLFSWTHLKWVLWSVHSSVTI